MADDAAPITHQQLTTEAVDGPVRHTLHLDLIIWHRGSAQASGVVNGYFNQLELALRDQLATAAKIVGQNATGVGLARADIAAKINTRVLYDPVDEAVLAEQLAGQAAHEQAMAQRRDQEVAASLRAAGKLY